jgi:4-carboxymuconolactone decarboxylase
MNKPGKPARRPGKRATELFDIVLGREGRRVLRAVKATSPDLARLLVEYPFGEIYPRTGLTLKMRELVAIASLASMGNARPQLKMHVHGALNVGCSHEEVLEVLLMVTVFAGFPAALNAVNAAGEVFKERGILHRREKDG